MNVALAESMAVLLLAATLYEHEMAVSRSDELTPPPRIGQRTAEEPQEDHVEQEMPDAAMEIFRMNVEMNPESANACDGLGEAYLLQGDRESAAKHYRRSLELNPDNANAREKLDALEQEKEAE